MKTTKLRKRLAPLMIALGIAGLGCGSGETARAKDEPAPVVQTEGVSLHERCVAGFQRMRTCTDVYIPALVGLRVKYDVPPGIAAEDAEQGRDALVAKALEEWETDSTDASFEALCGRIVSEASQEEQGRMVEVAERCEASGTCEEFVDCILPSLAARFGAPPPQ